MPVELQDCLCCSEYVRNVYRIFSTQKVPNQFKMTLSTKWGSTPRLIPCIVVCALCPMRGWFYCFITLRNHNLYICQLTANNPYRHIFFFSIYICKTIMHKSLQHSVDNFKENPLSLEFSQYPELFWHFIRRLRYGVVFLAFRPSQRVLLILSGCLCSSP